MIATPDEFSAYCFDRAVFVFGKKVEEAAEDAADGKKKAQAQVAAANVVALWTGAPMKFANPTPTR
jgi:hypothetical protein